MYQIMKNVLGIRQVTCCGNILWLSRRHCRSPSFAAANYVTKTLQQTADVQIDGENATERQQKHGPRRHDIQQKDA